MLPRLFSAGLKPPPRPSFSSSRRERTLPSHAAARYSDATGQKTIVISGNASDANVIKLTGNFLIASVLESLGEAFVLVRKCGIDPHRFLDSLTGTLFSAPVYQTYGSIIAEEKIPNGGFKMSLALKDMRLTLAAADAKTVPMPIASLLRDHLLEGVAQGEGDSDWSGLARLAARSAANAGLRATWSLRKLEDSTYLAYPN
jgi:3-hydroxyisobutyrate dehydrogenase-like beta-hydroxyacid dehydrogenase